MRCLDDDLCIGEPLMEISETLANLIDKLMNLVAVPHVPRPAGDDNVRDPRKGDLPAILRTVRINRCIGADAIVVAAFLIGICYIIGRTVGS